MRRTLVDERNARDVNWSESPQGESPGGWLGSGEFITSDDYEPYSDISLPRVQDQAFLFPARRIFQFTRRDLTFTNNSIIDQILFGIFGLPNQGPWSLSIPVGSDETGQVNISVYVRTSRDATATLRQVFLFSEEDPVVSDPFALTANMWTRLSWTFPTSDGSEFDIREFDPYIDVAPASGDAAPGDLIQATCAMFWNADAVVPYFDGESVDSWWNIRRGRDTPAYLGERSTGQTQSVRYRVAV